MKNTIFAISTGVLILVSASCGRKDSPASSRATEDRPDVPASAVAPGPADLPACPGYITCENLQGNKQAGSAILFSHQPVATVVDFYTTQLSADGWLLASTMQQDKEHHFQFTRDMRFLRLQIGPSEGPGATRIILAWKGSGGEAEANDSYAPDSEEDDPEHLNESSVEW